jgi:ribosomal protein L23
MQPRIQALRKPAFSGLAVHEVLLFPLITEKVVGIIEKQNKIAFIVNRKANKMDIKRAVEDLYKVKTIAITVSNDRKGRKRATVRLAKAYKADELATQLGVI